MTFEYPKLITLDGKKESGIESCLSEESFIEQLNRVCVVDDVLDGTEGQSSRIEYRDITPERLRYDQCVVFVGGLGTTAVDYTEQLRILTQQGRRVVYCNPLQGIAPSAELAAYAQEKGLPSLMAYKASEVLHVMERLGIEHADVIGHSQGGAVSTLVAAFKPESVDQLILNTPAGIVSRSDVKQLSRDIAGEFHAEKAFVEAKAATGDPTYKEAFARNMKAANTDPLYVQWRREEEIPAAGATSTIPLLRDLHARAQSGMPTPEVVLVTAQDDRIFTPEAMQRVLGDAIQEDSIVDRWVMYADPAIGHGPVQHHVNARDEALPQSASLLADLLTEHDAHRDVHHDDHGDAIEFKEAA